MAFPAIPVQILKAAMIYFYFQVAAWISLSDTALHVVDMFPHSPPFPGALVSQNHNIIVQLIKKYCPKKLFTEVRYGFSYLSGSYLVSAHSWGLHVKIFLSAQTKNPNHSLEMKKHVLQQRDVCLVCFNCFWTNHIPNIYYWFKGLPSSSVNTLSFTKQLQVRDPTSPDTEPWLRYQIRICLILELPMAVRCIIELFHRTLHHILGGSGSYWICNNSSILT